MKVYFLNFRPGNGVLAGKLYSREQSNGVLEERENEVKKVGKETEGSWSDGNFNCEFIY